MKQKLVVIAISLGVLTSILLTVVPDPILVRQQYPGYTSNRLPGSLLSEGILCSGITYESLISVGYPLKQEMIVDYDVACTGPPSWIYAAKSMLLPSFFTWQFYANCIFWSFVWFVLGYFYLKHKRK